MCLRHAIANWLPPKNVTISPANWSQVQVFNLFTHIPILWRTTGNWPRLQLVITLPNEKPFKNKIKLIFFSPVVRTNASIKWFVLDCYFNARREKIFNSTCIEPAKGKRLNWFVFSIQLWLWKWQINENFIIDGSPFEGCLAYRQAHWIKFGRCFVFIYFPHAGDWLNGYLLVVKHFVTFLSPHLFTRTRGTTELEFLQIIAVREELMANRKIFLFSGFRGVNYRGNSWYWRETDFFIYFVWFSILHIQPQNCLGSQQLFTPKRNKQTTIFETPR